MNRESGVILSLNLATSGFVLLIPATAIMLAMSIFGRRLQRLYQQLQWRSTCLFDLKIDRPIRLRDLVNVF